MVAQNVGFFLRLLSNTPFDFHRFIHCLQVDKLKLSNTSTTKPKEEKQANTKEEDNGKNKMQAQCLVTYFVIILLFILIIAITKFSNLIHYQLS